MIGWISAWLSRKIADRRRQRAVLEQVRANERFRQELLADPSLSPVGRLILWWETECGPGASDAELEQIERRYAVRLPEDFRAYLKTANPQGEDWDPEGTNWWPLSNIKSVREECGADWQTLPNAQNLLIFADFMSWCYAWSVDCSDGPDRGKVALITGLKDHYVADTFQEFVDLYLRDDPALHR